MITDLLLALVATVVDGLAELLPEMDLPYQAEMSSLGTTFAGYVRGMVGIIFPVDEYIAVVRDFVLVWFVGMLAFILVKWFFRYIPVVGK